MLHNTTEAAATDLRVSAIVTLGVLTRRLISWGRSKVALPALTSTKFSFSLTTVVHLPQKPEPTHFADTEKGQDYANQVPSPPPAYSLGPIMSSSASNKKSTPALSLDVNCDAEANLHSPLRSASSSPSTKTQSFSSRASLRMSMGAKKLYVDLSS